MALQRIIGKNTIRDRSVTIAERTTANLCCVESKTTVDNMSITEQLTTSQLFRWFRQPTVRQIQRLPVRISG